ncbi:MAG TPA: M23 family metallopeptidase [Candidatus Binatia bacterium]|nr:M23 family metallopeptidase [Candidatus Binatia bacterium]
MRATLFLLVAGAVAALLLTRAEPFAPRVVLDPPVEVIGRATPLHLVVRDRGTGLARVEVRLIGADGTAAAVATETYPRRSWFGSGVHEAVLDPIVDAGAARVPEGRATLEVRAVDHSWLGFLHRGPRLVRSVAVDSTPPTLELASQQHRVRVGGSECAVYRVGPDAVAHGVQVGRDFYPGTAGLFADGALRAALFAVAEDLPDAQPAIVATDAAGNRRQVAMGAVVQRRRFAEKTLVLAPDFLARKVPELLAANALEANGDLVAGYLRINRDLRAATEARVRTLCRESAPVRLWEGAFLRMPRSAPLSGFADRRTYVYDGKTIDHQTHLGFDLASTRGDVVPAGNTGRVVFAGPLGIYGNAVVLDHGLGLFSLYGHLSTIDVATGANVRRGDPIGRTGDTGLAGGDHLHFSVMIRGVHVDPTEWWDAHWIHDHVEARLDAFPRAGGGS